MRRSAVLGIAIIVLLIGTLAARAHIPTLSAQIDPAVATAVQQRLDATATAAAQFGLTQTIEAAINQALTATAAFALTVEAALNQAVQATYAATLVPNNTAWTPVVQDFDGVPMVFVPPGCFMMGSTDEQIAASEAAVYYPHWFTGEQPVHEQCFEEPFWIDQTEVTQAQFAALGGQAVRASFFSGDNRPVENITWFEARDFCALRGARLPTEAEWEFAARGPDSLVYPWGNEWNENNAVWNRTSFLATADVGRLPTGVSWVGALDMSGNVWEWVSSLHEPYPYNADDGREADAGNRTDVSRVLRGGSWVNNYAGDLRSAYRGGNYPVRWGVNLGFRCARSSDEGETYTIQPSSGIEATEAPPVLVTRNADWTPVVQDFDGVTMVQVPPGCFMMGSTDEQVAVHVAAGVDPDWFADEQPVHEQCFDEPFWIDMTEVTQAQFTAFGGQAASSSYFSGDNRPVERITWFEARDFCALRGARLPTEAEWEYAARGPDGLVYPWGNDWDENNAVWDGNSNGQTANVGSIPAGRAWVGAFDLSGNVWEWMSSLYLPYDSTEDREADTGNRTDVRRVLRGGSWDDYDSVFLRAGVRYRYFPDGGSGSFGFRCARSF